MRDRGEIHRVAILLGGLKANLARCRFGRFIEPIAEASNNALDPNLTRSSEEYLNKHVALDLLGNAFPSVHGFRHG
jgi:hypothetical protein